MDTISPATRPELLTIGELATILGIGKTKTYALLNSGQLLDTFGIRAVRVGDHWRFPRRDVERFLDGEQAPDHDRAA